MVVEKGSGRTLKKLTDFTVFMELSPESAGN